MLRLKYIYKQYDTTNKHNRNNNLTIEKNKNL